MQYKDNRETCCMNIASHLPPQQGLIHSTYMVFFGMLSYCLVCMLWNDRIAVLLSISCLFLLFMWRWHIHTSQLFYGWVLGYIYIALSWGGASPSDSMTQHDASSWHVVHTSLSGDIALMRHSLDQRNYIVRNYGCKVDSQPRFVDHIRGSISCSERDFVSVRFRILSYLQQQLMIERSPVNGWIYALFTGDKRHLDVEYSALMRQLGISHLASVSGLHLTIILLCIRFVLMLLRRILLLLPLIYIRRISWRWLAWSVEILLLLGWLYIIAFQASAVRAFCCYLGIQLTHHKWMGESQSLASKLMLSMMLFMIVTPLDIISFSSVLSWCAYLIIFLFLSYISCNSTEKKAKISDQQSFTVLRIRSSITMMLAMQCALCWIGFLMLGEVSLWSVVGNILIAPIFIAVFKIAILLNICLLPFIFVAGLTFIQHINAWFAQQIEVLFHIFTRIIEKSFHITPVLLDMYLLPQEIIFLLQWMTSFVIFALYWRQSSHKKLCKEQSSA